MLLVQELLTTLLACSIVGCEKSIQKQLNGLRANNQSTQCLQSEACRWASGHFMELTAIFVPLSCQNHIILLVLSEILACRLCSLWIAPFLYTQRCVRDLRAWSRTVCHAFYPILPCVTELEIEIKKKLKNFLTVWSSEQNVADLLVFSPGCHGQ